MGRDHHLGLLTTGKGFLDSANKLNDGPQWMAASLSVYYLYCHGMELTIKSFIYLDTKNDKELRGIGHDLEAAWNRALKLGVKKIYPEDQELQECIYIINPMYNTKELNYYFPGYKKGLPAIGNLSNACNNLYKALDQHYRELKKNI